MTGADQLSDPEMSPFDDPFVVHLMIVANAAHLRGDEHTATAMRCLLERILGHSDGTNTSSIEFAAPTDSTVPSGT